MIRREPARCLLLLFVCSCSQAEELNTAVENNATTRKATTLQFSKWSGEINVPDPVAIGFDNMGRAYVTQTQRRKSQDLDIRANREWIPSDVALETVTDKIDFYHRELAPGDDEENAKHVGDLNKDGRHDFRDLMVLSEKIHLLEDTDGDGTADSVKEFANNFQTEVTGIAAGVMHHDGEVYATIAPDVWKLRDTDGDGQSDDREILATGFGLHIAYAGHDMHGLTVGPDGKIYWSVGDKGISATSKEGKRFHYPNQGGVLRCNPDGSEFEVFAHGLRNVQELAFDQWGNLFGVDNDADKPGERERFVYIVKGMDAGWRCNYQYRGNDYDPWMAEKLWQPWHEGQPSYIVPPISHSIDGPAGFAFNPGTALSPQYKDFFFLTGAPGGHQIAFKVEPDRASFKMIEEHKIGSGVPLVGINFAPDGGLYGVDWGGGYPLNQKGAIWKIDDPRFAASENRREVKTLLADNFENRDTNALIDLLGHEDQRIRLRAQFELARQNALDEFISVVADGNPLLTRVHGIWGLGQLARAGNRDARAKLHALLSEFEEPELTFQTMRCLRDTKSANGTHGSMMLMHSSPKVRFMSAMVLADHPTPNASRHLSTAAKRTNKDETYLRCALARALGSCETEETLLTWKTKPDELMQLLAVVALRHQKSANLGEFTFGTSDAVATEAALAIHDDFSVPDAMPSLARALTTSECKTEAFVRRAINANFRIGDTASATRLMDYVLNQNVETKYRVAALRAIGAWHACPPLDFVTGRARTYGDRETPSEADLAEVFSRLLVDPDPKIASAALSYTAKLGIDVKSHVLVKIVRNESEPKPKRVAAIQLLATKESPNELAELAREISFMLDPEMRVAGLSLLSAIPRDKAMWIVREVLFERNSRRRFKSSTKERQLALTEFGKLAESKIDHQKLTDFVKAWEKGDHDVNDMRLEISEAAELRRNEIEKIDQILIAVEQDRNKRTTDPVAAYDDCLVGGDQQRGKELFFNHIGAQCVRCHKIGKRGSAVGPSLDGIAGRRDSSYLLRAIVAPSFDIDNNFRTTIVVLDDATTTQGVLVKSDDKTTVLRDAQGKDVEINNETIEETIEQEISMMPEMAKVLSRREIRDLVAYLTSLR